MLKLVFESRRKKQVDQTTEGKQITMINSCDGLIMGTRPRNPDCLKLSKEMKPLVHLLVVIQSFKD